MAEYKLSYTANEINKRLGEIDNAVKYTEQTLTEDQKAQARANIGAIAEGEGNIPGGVSSWNDLEDKPFSKETDGAIYTLSSWEQLTQPLYNAEEYTYGTKLFEADSIPGAVTVVIPDYGNWTTTLLLTPIDEYYSLGQFEIWGNKFAVYGTYTGRNYAIYALSSRSSFNGWTFEYRDFAKINHLPVEYLDVVELKNQLKVPTPWEDIPHSPFVAEYHYDSYQIPELIAYENPTIYTSEYTYTSGPIVELSAPVVSGQINIRGTNCVFSMTQYGENHWLSTEELSATGITVRIHVQKTGSKYPIEALAYVSSASLGIISDLVYCNPINVYHLPMDEIASSVIAALPRYNGEVADV